MRRLAPVLVAIAAVAAVVGAYLALGGASYRPAPVADPCLPRTTSDPDGTAEALERVALSALDSAACELGASREALVLALRDDAALAEFSREEGVTQERAEDALRRGLIRALDDAEGSGALSGLALSLVRTAVDRLPPRLLLELLEQLRGLVS